MLEVDVTQYLLHVDKAISKKIKRCAKNCEFNDTTVEQLGFGYIICYCVWWETV